MASSRTGTTKWKAVASAARKRAKQAGQEHCLYCQVKLNWDKGQLPDSAEADHIIPHSLGGEDRLSNTQITCRACNQSKGSRVSPKTTNVLQRKPLKTSRKWF